MNDRSIPSLQEYVKDPSILFTILVILVPNIYLDFFGMIRYMTTPMMLLSVIYLYMILYVTHVLGDCVQLSKRDKMVANWFLVNGVYFNLFLDVISGQFQMMDEMSNQYLTVEPRYALGLFHDAGAPVFMTSMCELFFQSPLAILTYYAYHRNKPYRRIVEFTVCLLHSAGVWWFYVPEALGGFVHLGGWPKSLAEAFSFHRLLFFWFGFWFCGLLWLIAPYHIAKRDWIEITNACREKNS